MGWDLKGIIGNAIAGAADAGSRYFVEERRKETELAAQKELADYKNEIELNKQQRLEEAKALRAERDLMRNRESNAANEELANDFAREQGHKSGTVGWYDAKADFLNRSGREDLAKEAYNQADKIRADDTKDQIAAARAAARAGGSGGGGGGGKAGAEDSSVSGFINDLTKDFKTYGLSGEKEAVDTTAKFIARDAFAKAYGEAKAAGKTDQEADAIARHTTTRFMGRIAAVQQGNDDTLRGKSAADINANFNATRKTADTEKETRGKPGVLNNAQNQAEPTFDALARQKEKSATAEYVRERKAREEEARLQARTEGGIFGIRPR